MRYSSLYDTNLQRVRYKIHQGGTSSSKTWTNLQYIVNYCCKHKVLVTICSESLPHLRRGAIRDFNLIITDKDFNVTVEENKSNHTFTFPNGSQVEFFGADDASKMRGSRRDILFINECNNVSYEAFQELDVRTKLFTILDFNPVSSFWLHKQLLPELDIKENEGGGKLYAFRKSTYLDAVDAEGKSLLTQETIDGIERRRHNVNWWRVYGEGEEGMLEGLVYTNWLICNEIPENATLLGYGMDFGFVNSPTAIVAIYEFENNLYIKELLYKTGIHNEELLAFAKNNIDLRARAIADSADPKTIDWLFKAGWYGLKPAVKGEDSVRSGIQQLQDRKLFFTKDSVNCINEARNYMWDTDKEGKLTNTPVKEYDHAFDALRYFYAYPKKRKLVI